MSSATFIALTDIDAQAPTLVNVASIQWVLPLDFANHTGPSVVELKDRRSVTVSESVSAIYEMLTSEESGVRVLIQ